MAEKLSIYRKMEDEIQKQWQDMKIFEENAPTDGSNQEKFFATFPYPYMNGKLHLGHSFSISKVEFAVAYQRQQGKKCLFPLGFHCTGMPILACAVKLKKEIEVYGNPPVFPDESGDNEDTTIKKKSKVQAKEGGSRYQWQILQDSGIAENEIAKFVEPEYWFEYFPKEARQDLESIGLGIDWRRSFITTQINPFYDSFVRWQFSHLKQSQAIKYGKRYSIYSPKDKQPCMDHDRASGEGVGPQERTLKKVKLSNSLPVLAAVSDKPVYFLTATLEPEAIQAQTNYIAFVMVNNEIGICTKRAALNMCYQNLTPNFGDLEIVAEISGQDLSCQQLKSQPNIEIVYKEPEKQIISRSGDECVVALCDQWFLDYGNEVWKNKVRAALDKMKTYPEASRKNFKETIDWLQEHACSRTYGLGTKLPWDESWLIESLSDSTIYMAYYTVAHLLQGGHLIGTDSTSPIGIKPEQMTINVWDYIFFGKEQDLGESTITRENLELLRKEFLFWYPMDLRSSGKDLIPNHLTYSIYNHCAIWESEPDKWPLCFRANGHLLLNGQKMSKSTGNFLTLEAAVKLYGADAVRYALADSGDGIDDANFVNNQAETGLLKLFNFLKWCEDTLESSDRFRDGCIDDNFADRYFNNAMNKLIEETRKQYDEMMFKEALKYGFFEYQELRTKYKEICGTNGFHKKLIRRFIETQAMILNPICPHIAQKIWQLLGNGGFIALSRWPPAEVDEGLYQSYTYLNEAIHEFRVRLRAFQAPPKNKKGQNDQKVAPKAKNATIYVAKTFPSWQVTVCQVLHDLYIEHNGQLPAKVGDISINKVISSKLSEYDSLRKYMKKVMPFAEMRKQLIIELGEEAFNLTSPFDEREVLENSMVYLVGTLGVQSVIVKNADESDDSRIAEDCCPLNPIIVFSSE